MLSNNELYQDIPQLSKSHSNSLKSATCSLHTNACTRKFLDFQMPIVFVQGFRKTILRSAVWLGVFCQFTHLLKFVLKNAFFANVYLKKYRIVNCSFYEFFELLVLHNVIIFTGKQYM